jgi:hypothetical protein
MSQAKIYHYEPLRLANEVRLLELKPGLGIDHLAISLQCVSLDSIPPYEAISYCWGSNNRDCDIEVHGDGTIKHLSITTSLFTALKRFRRPDETRILWVDAICINQDQDKEKNAQVILMPKIYSKAHRVLIWLGEDMCGVEGVGESLLQAQTLLPTEAIDAKKLQEASDGLLQSVLTNIENNQMNWMDHDWSSIDALMSRPWFQRRWIIQETAFAQEAIVVCGEIVFPWKDLAAVAIRVAQLGLQPWIKASVAMFKSVQTIGTLMLFQHYHGVGTLLDAVQTTAYFQCGDPRDNIFALLSLAKDGASIQPDYTLTVEEVFKNFTVYCLDRGEFNVLSIAPNTLLESRELDNSLFEPNMLCMPRPDIPTLSLPSWVADLTRQGDFDSLVSYTVRGRLFNAGGSADVNPPTVRDGRYLRLRGFIFDLAAVVAPSIFETYGNPMPDHLRAKWSKDDKDAGNANWRFGLWLQQCRDFFANQHGQLGCAEFATFYRTMTCQLTGMHDRERRDLSRAFAAYIHFCLSLHLERKVISDDPAYELYHKHGVSFNQLVRAVSKGRRLCKTGHGYYAAVPLSTKPDDVICIVAGAETPYVLRNTGSGTFTLIGPCYVDGIMDGEAVASGEYQIQDIVLE